MQKLNLKIILTLALFLFLPNFVFGAPSISGVSGTIVDGQSVTISGSGFGIKMDAAPILWENFDSGTNGQAIGGWNGWVKYSGVNGGYLSNSSVYSGTLSAYNRITGPSATDPITDSGFNTSNFFFEPTDELYYSYVAKFVSTGDSYGVDKWGRSNCAPNLYNGPGDMTIQFGQVTFNTGTATNDVLIADGGLSKWVQTRYSDWTRHEMYKKLSTPGVADGMAQFKLGYTVRTYSNIVTREEGFSFQITNIILGLMFANSRNDGDHRMYVDDVYVDNTRARVEVCFGDTWDNRGNCDIQIPSAWSATSNTITINQGSFSDGDSAYLYVVDENGEVNETGYPITFSSSGEISIINSPTGLGVI